MTTEPVTPIVPAGGKSTFMAEVFSAHLTAMKGILDLGEFHWGKASSEFKTFRSGVMDKTYNAVAALGDKLLREGVVQNCECNANLRQGYSGCPKCGGCGYRTV